jgi:hypothetical protein
VLDLDGPVPAGPVPSAGPPVAGSAPTGPPAPSLGAVAEPAPSPAAGAGALPGPWGGAAEGAGGPLSTGLTSASLTTEELLRASGLDAGELADLERYGLLTGRAVGGAVHYDEDALVVARLAAGFARHGVEPRHLRMIRTAADREAALYEQLVAPMSSRRHDPAARRRTVETLEDLVRLGAGLRAALLRQALRGHVRDGG